MILWVKFRALPGGSDSIEKSWANMKRFLRGNLDRFVSVEFAIYAHFILSEI